MGTSEYNQESIETSGNPYEDNSQNYYNKNNNDIISQLVNTEDRLERLKREWRGEVLVNNKWIRINEELATDEFINKQITALRSILTPVNAFTRRTDDELRVILHDAVEAFIKDMANESEEFLATKDMETMSKSFEHSIELFLGLSNGHGAEFLSQTIIGAHKMQQEQQQPQKKSWSEVLKQI